SADTFFYWVATSGDGRLTSSDFESPAEIIPDAVMVVPPSMQFGDVGTFSFDVLDQLRDSARNGFRFFAIQGRVDEKLQGSVRGLEVRTTASENVTDNNVPILVLATPGITVPLLYRITSLPQSGFLRDASNHLIDGVPYDLPRPEVTYMTSRGFVSL